MTYSAHLLPPDVRPTARDYPGLSGPDTIWVDERWWRFTAHTDLHTVRYLDVRHSDRSVALAMLLITPRPGGLLFYDPPRLAGTPGALAEPELLDPSGRQRWDELTASLPGADEYPSLALATFGNHHGVAHAPDRTADQRSAVMAALPELLLKTAADLGCRSIALLYVGDPDAAAILAGRDKGNLGIVRRPAWHAVFRRVPGDLADGIVAQIEHEDVVVAAQRIAAVGGKSDAGAVMADGGLAFIEHALG